MLSQGFSHVVGQHCAHNGGVFMPGSFRHGISLPELFPWASSTVEEEALAVGSCRVRACIHLCLLEQPLSLPSGYRTLGDPVAAAGQLSQVDQRTGDGCLKKPSKVLWHCPYAKYRQHEVQPLFSSAG